MDFFGIIWWMRPGVLEFSYIGYKKQEIALANQEVINGNEGLTQKGLKKAAKLKADKETPCHDGQIRSVTYATKKGLDYVRKLLRKNGYYTNGVVVA